jgi:peroxiredoxin (alkyl hydroperoxide reductase subunit C)
MGASEGCVKVAAGPIGAGSPPEEVGTSPGKEVQSMTIARVGHPAPDFEANVYQDGTFKTLRLSDYKGKWIVLCFYPGDFTFV